MWTCPRCGEPNEDTFRECWKCISDEMAQHVSAAPPPPPPAPPRELRSVSAVLRYIALGFFVGMMLGMITFQRLGIEAASFAGVIVGLAMAGAVSVFVWVIFPFEPSETNITAADELADDD